MTLFRSSREKRYWLASLLVIIAIFTTLIIGRPLESLLRSQDVQAIFFLLGMALVSATIVLSGLKKQSSTVEIVVWIGLLAVYLMLFFRLGAPERSHLIEYSVLAIFVHLALIVRFGDNTVLWKPALLAVLITFCISVIDEFLQVFLPNRVFDPVDILFNGMVTVFAIGSKLLLQWMKRLMIRKRNQSS